MPELTTSHVCAAAGNPVGAEAIFNGDLIAKIRTLIVELGANAPAIIAALESAGLIPAAYLPYIEMLVTLLIAINGKTNNPAA